MHVLLTGASGFVGHVLAPALTRAGHRVRRAARAPERLPRMQSFAGNVDDVPFDLDDADSVAAAVAGVDVAYYLVHGLHRGAGYGLWEEDVAARFAEACAHAGVKRIVYLGAPTSLSPSPHLQARLATATALHSAGVPVVELRATMIVGTHSESWRLCRDIAARAPFLPQAPWLWLRQAPVAIDDVVDALVFAARAPASTYSVPGPELLSGRAILDRTAGLLGRSLVWLPLPAPPAAWSARVLQHTTRCDAGVAAELLLSLQAGFSLDDPSLFSIMPPRTLRGFDDAACAALRDDDDVTLRARLTEYVLRRASRAPEPSRA